jgi:hypothetical protein
MPGTAAEHCAADQTFGDSKDMKNEFGGPTSQVRGSMLVLCFSWLNDENQP